MRSQQSHTLAVVLAVVMAVVMAVVLTVVLAVVLTQIKSTVATSDECMIDALPHTNVWPWSPKRLAWSYSKSAPPLASGSGYGRDCSGWLRPRQLQPAAARPDR